MSATRSWTPFAPKRRFVVLTTGRSGSELLVSLLDAHPEIACDGEVLRNSRAFPDYTIRSRAALAGLHRARAYGFKLTRDNLLGHRIGNPAGFIRRLHERGYRMILLTRRDLLQQAISFVRAEKLGYIHHRRGEAGRFAALTVDPLAVVWFMFLIEEVTRFFADALVGIPFIDLVYEDRLMTAERQQQTVDEICRALGIAQAPVRSELLRLTPKDPLQQLSNFEDLARVLSVTRYAKYLPDAVRPA